MHRSFLRNIAEPSFEVLKHITLIAMLFYILTPLVWLFITAFHPRGGPYLEIPENPTLENFLILFGVVKMRVGAAAHPVYMHKWLLNSFIIAITTMVIVVVLSAMAGYALSRLKFKGKSVLMASLLIIGFMPTIAKLLPLYKLCIMLGFINNLIGVAIVVASGALPVQIWIMKGFFDHIPRDLEEQAWIFGCSKLSALFRVVMPVAGPGLMVVAFFGFLAGWGNFTVPLILIRTETLFPVSLGIASVFLHHPGEIGLAVEYGPLCALSLIYALPSIMLYYLTRRYLMHIRLARIEVGV